MVEFFSRSHAWCKIIYTSTNSETRFVILNLIQDLNATLKNMTYHKDISKRFRVKHGMTGVRHPELDSGFLLDTAP